MENDHTWVSYPMHCSNCGAIIVGFKSKKGGLKYHCENCKCSLVRVDRSRRHATIDIFAPDGEELLLEIPSIVRQ